MTLTLDELQIANVWPELQPRLQSLTQAQHANIETALKYNILNDVLLRRHFLGRNIEKIFNWISSSDNKEDIVTINDMIMLGRDCSNTYFRFHPNEREKYTNISQADYLYIHADRPILPVLSVFSKTVSREIWPCVTACDNNYPCNVIQDPFILDLINKINNAEVFRDLLNVLAIDSLSSDSHIEFNVAPMRDQKYFFGMATLDGKIVVYINDRDINQIFGTLIHEIAHVVMQILFKNNSKPYSNIGSNYNDFEQNIVRETMQNFYKYFAPNRDIPSDTIKLAKNLIALKSEVSSEDMLLIDRIVGAFTGETLSANYHSDFIVRPLELIAILGKLPLYSVECLEPVLNFYKNTLTPAMREYVQNSQNHDKLIIDYIHSETLLAHADNIEPETLLQEICNFDLYSDLYNQ
jgi:hypothetical protein